MVAKPAAPIDLGCGRPAAQSFLVVRQSQQHGEHDAAERDSRIARCFSQVDSRLFRFRMWSKNHRVAALMANMALHIGVTIGLVMGVTAATTPMGFAT
jgi:hypothetical protein